MGHGPDDCPRQIGKGGDVAGVGRGRVDGALCVVRPVWRLRYGGLQAAPEAVVLAVHLQDVDVAGEPAQQRPGEPLRAEAPGPLVDGQVDVHQDGAPLAALVEDLEEQFRTGAGQGYGAQLVHALQPATAGGTDESVQSWPGTSPPG